MKQENVQVHDRPCIGVEMLTNALRLSWSTNGDGDWVLQFNTNLLESDWSLVTNTPVSSPIDIPIDPDIAPIFYRLELQ